MDIATQFRLAGICIVDRLVGGQEMAVKRHVEIGKPQRNPLPFA